VELIDSELCPASAEKDAFTATVRFEFFVIFRSRWYDRPRSGVPIKFFATILASCEVTEGLEIVIEEVCRLDFVYQKVDFVFLIDNLELT
jgi:hypothetical protein